MLFYKVLGSKSLVYLRRYILGNWSERKLLKDVSLICPDHDISESLKITSFANQEFGSIIRII